MFVGPGVEVYEGMVIGQNTSSEDMDVNVTAREEADQRSVGCSR